VSILFANFISFLFNDLRRPPTNGVEYSRPVCPTPRKSFGTNDLQPKYHPGPPYRIIRSLVYVPGQDGEQSACHSLSPTESTSYKQKTRESVV
jgi:hypothetical protein